MPQIQVNKWVRLALTIGQAIFTSLIVYPWSDLVGADSAAKIVLGITVIKGIIDSLAPAAGTVTQPTTSGSQALITHRAVA